MADEFDDDVPQLDFSADEEVPLRGTFHPVRHDTDCCATCGATAVAGCPC